MNVEVRRDLERRDCTREIRVLVLDIFFDSALVVFPLSRSGCSIREGFSGIASGLVESDAEILLELRELVDGVPGISASAW